MVEFQPDYSIFKNEEVLQSHYVPDELVGREEELNEYKNVLQPVINGAHPRNVLLLGKSGVGKTAATKSLLTDLERAVDQYHDFPLTTIWENCQDNPTSYQVAVNLVNQLRNPENTISTTGYPSGQIYNFLWEELDSVGGTILVVLDEVDHLEDDSILYELSRAKANEYIENARIGVIGISNALGYRDQLSGKVKSSLSERELRFAPYDAQELHAVLRDRIEIGFQDNTVDEGVVELCAAYGAKDGGDARQAIKLLYEAGTLAREANADDVTQTHVEKARNNIENNQVLEGTRELSEQERVLLYAITTLEKQGETPARTSKIYNQYRSILPGDLDAVGNRRIRDHITTLADLDLVIRETFNKGRSGGKGIKVSLVNPIELMVEALREIIERCGVHTAIQEEYREVLDSK